MCLTCGCGDATVKQVTIDSRAKANQHHHSGSDARHNHHPDEAVSTRLVRLERDLLGENNRLADANRLVFEDRETFVLNLVSSPGSGKTKLLVRTVEDLKARFPIAVIEGDQETDHDAERIREAGVPAVQINTGKVCHLDADMVGRAVARFDLPKRAVLFIENVGNLVCPAGFDLGEHHKVVVASVTEGEDKPLKYPNMFAAADLVLLNKIDLLPYLTFDVDRFTGFARRIRSEIPVLKISATTGTGLSCWYDWIESGLSRVKTAPNRERSAG